MRRTTVQDVMTTEVVCVSLSTPFKEIAQVLQSRRVSALPVLDGDGDLVGVVSEADLLLKQRRRDGRHTPGWLTTPHLREVMAKAAGGVAGELMTSPPVTVRDNATLTEAARLMIEQKVKRLPVLDINGRLIGIVSRFDLVKIFARPDDDIRGEVNRELVRRVLLTEPGTGRVTVEVENGTVTLSGDLERRSSADIAVRIAREVDGVVGVVNKLSYAHDDTESKASRILGTT